MMAFLAVAAAAGPAPKSSGLPQFNPEFFTSQLFWLVVTFVALYLFMSRVALPRIAGVVEEREGRITRDLQRAERLKSETEEALAAYEKSLADARAKAGDIARQTRERAAAEVDGERAAVERQLGERLAAAEKRIAASKAAALSSVNEIAAETAGELVAKLSGLAVTKDEAKAALARQTRS